MGRCTGVFFLILIWLRLSKWTTFLIRSKSASKLLFTENTPSRWEHRSVPTLRWTGRFRQIWLSCRPLLVVRDGFLLQGLQEGNGYDQQGLHRDDDRRRCQWQRLPVSDSDLFHYQDFDWSDTENNRLLFEMTSKYGTPYFPIILTLIWNRVMCVPCAADCVWI